MVADATGYLGAKKKRDKENGYMDELDKSVQSLITKTNSKIETVLTITECMAPLLIAPIEFKNGTFVLISNSYLHPAPKI